PNNGGPHPGGPAPRPNGHGPKPNGHGASSATGNSSTPNSGSANDNADTSRSSRSSKAELLIEMLLRPAGASMEELQEALGTQQHSIRAAISVETRKRGLRAVLENGRYRAEPEVTAAAE